MTKVITSGRLESGYKVYLVVGLRVYIKNISKKGKTPYYAVYANGKYVKYIGNADHLKVFERDIQIGQEAAEFLKQMPYLNPKASLSIIASGEKNLVGKIPLPDKQYRTIVIDPPWPIEKILRDNRPNQFRLDYPTMEIEEIKALPINEMALADGCHIYLWTTQKYLPIAFEVLASWGIEYQCLMTWIKNVGFTPFSWMYSTEHCLFGHIGNLSLLRLGKRLDFSAKVREHSRKPEIFYEIVREVSPAPRIDIFGREKHEGFETYGNETSKF